MPGADAKAISKTLANTLMSLLSPAIRKVQARLRSRRTDSGESARCVRPGGLQGRQWKVSGEARRSRAEVSQAFIPGDIFAGKALIYKPTEEGLPGVQCRRQRQGRRGPLDGRRSQGRRSPSPPAAAAAEEELSLRSRKRLLSFAACGVASNRGTLSMLVSPLLFFCFIADDPKLSAPEVARIMKRS